MRISPCHDSILHSRASVLIIGLSRDGTILAPALQRLMGLYPCFYQHYKDKAQKGELALGEVLVHLVQKQTSGLASSTNTKATYVIGVIAQNHATQHTHVAAWQQACLAINPKLYEFMRYKHLHQVALLAPKENASSFDYRNFWHSLQKLNTPRVHIDVHFDKSVDIASFESYQM